MSTPTNANGEGDRRRPAAAALIFYAIPAAVAWAWLRFAHPGRSAELWGPPGAARDAAIGAAAGLALAGASILAMRSFRWARGLDAEFGRMLGGPGRGGAAWLALLSGFSEEYFFRGALQEELGLWAAAAVFGAAHWPLNRRFLPWPFAAAVIGAGLGGLREWTGALVAPAAAHAVVNLVHLWRITGRYREWDEARVDAYVETGRWT